MVAVQVGEIVDIKFPEFTRLPQLGDILQIHLNETSRWVQFWNYPLRDKEDIDKAREIIKTRGMCFYSKPDFARDFRVVTQVMARVNFKEEMFRNYRGQEFTLRFWED